MSEERPPQRYILGLDLGQSQDYSALVIAERHGREAAQYQVRHLERFALGTPYPAIVAQVQSRLQALPLVYDRGLGFLRAHLVVDATGCGRPVVDMFQQARLDPIAVIIHGGDQVSRDGGRYRVPKRDLVGGVQTLLQTRRLRIAQGHPLAQALVEELLNFRVTIDPKTAHDSYSAWREGVHDDLVLAVALACWWGERWQPMSVGVLRI